MATESEIRAGVEELIEEINLAEHHLYRQYDATKREEKEDLQNLIRVVISMNGVLKGVAQAFIKHQNLGGGQ